MSENTHVRVWLEVGGELEYLGHDDVAFTRLDDTGLSIKFEDDYDGNRQREAHYSKEHYVGHKEIHSEGELTESAEATA